MAYPTDAEKSVSRVIGFSGHRDAWADPRRLAEIADQMPGRIWLHGGAEGFDTQVQHYADLRGIGTQIIRPDYDTWPAKIAPLKRNDRIIEQSDLVVVCRDTKRETGGTTYVHRKVVEIGKPGILIPPVFTGLVSYQLNYLLAGMVREYHLRACLDEIAERCDEKCCCDCEGSAKCTVHLARETLERITPSRYDREALRAKWGMK